MGRGTESPPSLRELNRSRVIEALRELGVASRADVARHTGLSRTTISGLVAEMREEGLVVDRPTTDSNGHATGAGRPATPIGLSPRAGAAVGIDFGKRHLAVVIADLSHSLLAEDRREMEEGYDSRLGMENDGSRSSSGQSGRSTTFPTPGDFVARSLVS